MAMLSCEVSLIASNMATKGTVRKIEIKVKHRFSIMEMRLSVLKHKPTNENLERYYLASDNLDDAMDEYYAACIMFFSIEKQDLYDLYIEQPKDAVKKKFLRQITDSKRSALAYSTNERRLKHLEEEKQRLMAIKANKSKIEKINKSISRLTKWLEYE